MRIAAFLVALMLAPAMAQTAEEAVPDGLDNLASSPRAIGPRHSCYSEYPPSVRQAGYIGATALVFVITAEGKVANAIVMASSNFIDVDLGALRCVSKWLYEPARRNGVPVAVDWEATVSFTVNGAKNEHIPSSLHPLTNCIVAHPDAPQRAAAADKGVTVVWYRLEAGKVTEASIKFASGDATLDSYALSCVQSWQFKPEYENGSPATGRHAAIIDWTGVRLIRQ